MLSEATPSAPRGRRPGAAWRTERAPPLCVAGHAGLYDHISTQGWFIGLMCAVAALTLTLLTVCFVKRNRGGKYSGNVPPPRVRGPGSRHARRQPEALWWTRAWFMCTMEYCPVIGDGPAVCDSMAGP